MEIAERFRKNKKLMMRSVVLLVIVIALKLTVFGPVRVETVTPERRELTAQVYGNGTVEAKVIVQISSKITGRIVALHADQGDMVKKGQLLARLENDDFSQQVSQSHASAERAAAQLNLEMANLQKAKATLELAEKNAQRYRNLATKNLVARQEAEQYETACRVAREEVARSQAAIDAARFEQRAGRAGLGVAKSRMGDTFIYAPQDGLIISRDLEQGAVVSPGGALFRMIDPRVVWVKANMDEASLKGLAVGNEAAITLRSAADEAIPGKVVRIGHESDRITEELEVDVAFVSPLTALRIGEQADVLITTATKRGVPAIPTSALTTYGGKRGVWLAENGRLRFRAVQAGIEDRSGFTEVVAGLGEKDRVVRATPDKMRKFHDGQKVRIVR